MQPISIQTTPEKFIVSIDKRWIDSDVLARFIENLTLRIRAKDVDFEGTLAQFTPEEPPQTPRYAAAQRFKSSAKSAYVTSKYDVYGQ